MKHPTGPVRPRRTAAPKAPPKPRKKVRLDLKRRPVAPEPEEQIELRQKSHFWRWVGIVALFHLMAICAISIYYKFALQPKPPEQFISLLPDGAVVKGNPGEQEAHKLGAAMSQASVHHSAAKASEPHLLKHAAPPKPTELAAIENPLDKMQLPKTVKHKHLTPKPKVKVDLHLADGPTPPVDKPKLLAKKPVLRTDDADTDSQDSEATPDLTGLSKEQIAEKLGEKLDNAGVQNATQIGKSGSANGHANDFSAFYELIHDQVMSQWQSPNLAEQPAVNPVVQIYVEKDGRVPPESVQLTQSSGNTEYDDSAVAAAKSLGYLHEPLPDGCNPVITIDFKLTR